MGVDNSDQRCGGWSLRYARIWYEDNGVALFVVYMLESNLVHRVVCGVVQYAMVEHAPEGLLAIIRGVCPVCVK